MALSKENPMYSEDPIDSERRAYETFWKSLGDARKPNPFFIPFLITLLVSGVSQTAAIIWSISRYQSTSTIETFPITVTFLIFVAAAVAILMVSRKLLAYDEIQRRFYTGKYVLGGLPLTAPLHISEEKIPDKTDFGFTAEQIAINTAATEAVLIWHTFGISNFKTVKLDELRTSIQKRHDEIQSYRPGLWDRIKRTFGLKKRWPIIGFTIMDENITADQYITSLCGYARSSSIKLIFIGEQSDEVVLSNLIRPHIRPGFRNRAY